MKLSIDYLIGRHNYWINAIGERNIWSPANFLPVEIVIRKDCKSYNGKFQRKTTISSNTRKIEDKIVIYNKTEDFDPKFLNSVIVHEMIHQYIIQNNIKDTSTHGKIFRSFMKSINTTFPDELQINIRSHNPGVPTKGPGQKSHHILILQHTDDYWFLAVVNPKKLNYFDSYLNKMSKRLNIRSYFWAQSDDVYFNNFRRCTTALHGLKKTTPEFFEFCKEYRVIKTYP